MSSKAFSSLVIMGLAALVASACASRRAANPWDRLRPQCEVEIRNLTQFPLTVTYEAEAPSVTLGVMQPDEVRLIPVRCSIQRVRATGITRGRRRASGSVRVREGMARLRLTLAR